MTQEVATNTSLVVWQRGGELDISEAAILINNHSDIICIYQEDRYINLNYESVEEFIKALRRAVKNKAE